MPPKIKQKKSNDESSDSSSSDSGDESDTYAGNEVIQVEFEGRNPMTSDFHGIRQLLHQLFLKSDINLSELADIVTDQNFIGSVVIQSFLDDDDDDDSDDDENTGTNFDSSGTIFGITTAVNISKSQSHGCIEDIRKHLQIKCEQFAKDDVKKVFMNALNDDTKQTGLLINERFINIPAQIAVPLLENLQSEIAKATIKNPKYNFNQYIMIVKFNRKKGKGKHKDQIEDIYSNGEEEIVDEHADACFEYSAERETDTTLSGNWTESDITLVPHRKVVIFDANKLPSVIDAIKGFIDFECLNSNAIKENY